MGTQKALSWLYSMPVRLFCLVLVCKCTKSKRGALGRTSDNLTHSGCIVGQPRRAFVGTVERLKGHRGPRGTQLYLQQPGVIHKAPSTDASLRRKWMFPATLSMTSTAAGFLPEVGRQHAYVGAVQVIQKSCEAYPHTWLKFKL